MAISMVDDAYEVEDEACGNVVCCVDEGGRRSWERATKKIAKCARPNLAIASRGGNHV